MARSHPNGLTPRETQIMQVIWRNGEASVEMIQAELPDALVDSTIRTMLLIMEDKAYVTSRKQGRAKIYRARIAQAQVQKSAVKQMIHRLFDGSAALLLAQLVEDRHVDLTELDRMRRRLQHR